MQIYVSKDGQQYGPYTVKQLQGYVRQGNFTTADLACYDGQNWVTVEQVPGFVQKTNPIASPPPLKEQLIQPVPGQSGMAIASLVTALLGVPIVSIVLGHLARGQIKRSQGATSGSGLALAGLILGYLQLVLLIVGVVAVLVMYNLSGSFESGKNDIARNWINGPGKAAVTTYYIQSGNYPNYLDDLLTTVAGTTSPVVDKPGGLLDPWGKKYQYKAPPGDKNPGSFDLWTTSPEGEVIGNWDSE